MRSSPRAGVKSYYERRWLVVSKWRTTETFGSNTPLEAALKNSRTIVYFHAKVDFQTQTAVAAVFLERLYERWFMCRTVTVATKPFYSTAFDNYLRIRTASFLDKLNQNNFASAEID